MKLKLNKKKLKNLSLDNKALPADMTPNIGGGFDTYECDTDTNPTTWPAPTNGCVPGPTMGAACQTARDCGGGMSDPRQNPYCNTDGCY